MVPPSVAAMHTSAHSRTSPPGSHGPSTQTSPAPVISSGARMPPDVPEPSATTTTTAITSPSATTTCRAKTLVSGSPISSTPTPGAHGTTHTPTPQALQPRPGPPLLSHPPRPTHPH